LDLGACHGRAEEVGGFYARANFVAAYHPWCQGYDFDLILRFAILGDLESLEVGGAVRIVDCNLIGSCLGVTGDFKNAIESSVLAGCKRAFPQLLVSRIFDDQIELGSGWHCLEAVAVERPGYSFVVDGLAKPVNGTLRIEICEMTLGVAGVHAEPAVGLLVAVAGRANEVEGLPPFDVGR